MGVMVSLVDRGQNHGCESRSLCTANFLPNNLLGNKEINEKNRHLKRLVVY